MLSSRGHALCRSCVLAVLLLSFLLSGEAAHVSVYVSAPSVEHCANKADYVNTGALMFVDSSHSQCSRAKLVINPQNCFVQLKKYGWLFLGRSVLNLPLETKQMCMWNRVSCRVNEYGR